MKADLRPRRRRARIWRGIRRPRAPASAWRTGSPALRRSLGLGDLELLLGLDAFDDGGDAEAARQPHHGADDGLAVLAHQHVADERAVDLDLVEREVPQIGQRRIAGAEIVHRNPHADLAKLMQERERVGLVLQQHGLGDLEVEPAGGKARRRQRVQRQLHEIAALELHGRQVDRDADRLRPLGRLRRRRCAAPIRRAAGSGRFPPPAE